MKKLFSLLVISSFMATAAFSQTRTIKKVQCVFSDDQNGRQVFDFTIEGLKKVSVVFSGENDEGPVSMTLPAKVTAYNATAKLVEVGYFMGTLRFNLLNKISGFPIKIRVDSTVEGWTDTFEADCRTK